MRTAPDNIISISLGAILSRAVVGASAFIPVVVTCFVIVLNALIVRPLCGNSAGFARLMEGDKILLYSDSKFIDARLKRTQLSKEDIMQGVRKSALTEGLGHIDKVYIERNGGITAIKKARRACHDLNQFLVFATLLAKCKSVNISKLCIYRDLFDIPEVAF